MLILVYMLHWGICQTLPSSLLSPSLLGPDYKWKKFKKILTIVNIGKPQQTYKNSSSETALDFHPCSFTFSFSALSLSCQLKLVLDKDCVYSDRPRRNSRIYQHQKQKYNDNPASCLYMKCWGAERSCKEPWVSSPYNFVFSCHLTEMQSKARWNILKASKTGKEMKHFVKKCPVSKVSIS